MTKKDKKREGAMNWLIELISEEVTKAEEEDKTDYWYNIAPDYICGSCGSFNIRFIDYEKD
ncbi:MAG: hypothetical protein GY870_15280 [archaeon]|nr:hypothetical protein [archaeon]